MSRATLDRLLLHSYENYQVLFNHQAFHNHNAHHLGALYLLGANEETLERAYEKMQKIVDSYEPSPHSITGSNWRNFLGDKRFCQAYKDFFEQDLRDYRSDWTKRLLQILLEDNVEPLINALVCGLAHPLIHVGYAFELDSLIVGIEAVTVTAVAYAPLHKIIDKLEIPKFGTKSIQNVLDNVRSDDRLTLETTDMQESFRIIMGEYRDIILSHFYSWKFDENNLSQVIENLFDSVVYLYGATHNDDKVIFNFIILHLLTGIHGIRVIHLHLNDQEVMGHLILQFFYFIIVVYVVVHRPKIKKSLIDDYKVDDSKNNWDYVVDRTLNSNLVYIMHMVKVIYTLRAAETKYGSKDGLYLKTAVKTVDNVSYEQPWLAASDNPEYLMSLKHK